MRHKSFRFASFFLLTVMIALLLAAVYMLTYISAHFSNMPQTSQPIEAPSLPILGVAVGSWELQDEMMTRTITSYGFGSVTPENEMKMETIEPVQGQFNFGPADSIVAFAKAHNMRVHGHTLVWHSQLPSWLTAHADELSRDQMIAIMKNHIEQVVSHYKGTVGSWDVVNEAVDGSGLRTDSIWEKKIGPDYIEMAFRFAHEADPQAKLYYNDYSAENINEKSTYIYNLVKNLRQKGVPIDGVGFQAHFGEGNWINFASFGANMQRFADLGVAVRVSELDFGIPDTSDSSLISQAHQYQSVVSTCVAHSNCTGVTVWGVTDAHTWRAGQHPLMFDEFYNPKPAYDAVATVLKITPGQQLISPIPTPTTAPIQQVATPTPMPIPTSLPSVTPGGVVPIGYHDTATWESIKGWACDQDDVTQPLTIHFYTDGPAGQGTFIGQTVANVPREAAVGALCGGNSNHGFSFPTPPSLNDGRAHSIYAYAINILGGGSNPLLGTSPRTLAPQISSPVNSTITIYAAGTPLNGIYPTMQLRINGQSVKEWTNIQGNPYSRNFGIYSYHASAHVSASQVEVAFTNDAYAPPQDRNLVVDRIEIDGVPYQTEAPTTFSTGSWVNNTCGSTYAPSEWLYCKGSFHY